MGDPSDFYGRRAPAKVTVQVKYVSGRVEEKICANSHAAGKYIAKVAALPTVKSAKVKQPKKKKGN